MQVIDFINNKGYKLVRFPDGELHLELEPLNRKHPVAVVCRITKSDDLFIMMQLADILKRQCVEVSSLSVYYLMGMRCDRLFDLNRPFTLSLVADVLNALNARRVYLYEPHSERALRLIKNSGCCDVTTAVLDRIRKNDKYLLVAPDKGACDRYVDSDFSVVCHKQRDEATGNLTGFSISTYTDVSGENLLVVDDLCDGGGTFVGLAPKLRNLAPKSLSLLVTHAVQKAGIDRVAAYYDKVYITDSYKDWSAESLPENVEVVTITNKITS